MLMYITVNLCQNHIHIHIHVYIYIIGVIFLAPRQPGPGIEL